MSADDLLIVAGEASGDLHGGRLLAELSTLAPRLRPFGMGGAELEAVRFAEHGFEAVAHSSEIAVVGISEALRILPRAFAIQRQLLAEVDRRQARSAILIDSPDFNLPLAKKLDRRGVRVFYYISPQLWAWRKGRVKTVARHVYRMLVLFSFELEFYRRHGVEAVHVGHPLIDEVPRLDHVWDREGNETVLALLPGSRRSEVQAILPTMLEAARQMIADRPLEVRLIRAPTVPAELIDDLVAASGLAPEIVDASERFQTLADSDLALCASGTATLEVGLSGTPLVVVYRVQPPSYFLGRLLIDLESISMVNLVLQKKAVPELLQRDAVPERIASEALELLDDPAALAAMRADLAELWTRLGRGGASRRAAEEIAAGIAEAAASNGDGGMP